MILQIRFAVTAFLASLFLLAAVSTVPPAGRAAESNPDTGGPAVAGFAEWLYGDWRWTSSQGQVMQMSFYRGGGFRFSNTTMDFGHRGSFRVAGGTVHLVLTRFCRQGQCRAYNPPKRQTYPIRRLSQDAFMSANERWIRVQSR